MREQMQIKQRAYDKLWVLWVNDAPDDVATKWTCVGVYMSREQAFTRMEEAKKVKKGGPGGRSFADERHRA